MAPGDSPTRKKDLTGFLKKCNNITMIKVVQNLAAYFRRTIVLHRAPGCTPGARLFLLSEAALPWLALGYLAAQLARLAAV